MIQAVPPAPLPLARFTVARTLAEVEPWIPPALVPAEAWAAVTRAAALLPAALTRAVYLECRLGAGSAPVDMIARVEPDGAAILAGRNPAARLAPGVAAGPGWRRVARLCERWLDGAAPFAGVVTHLWLEFDLEGATPGAPLPQPSLFAALRDDAAATLSAPEWERLADGLAAALAPHGAPAGAGRRVAELVARRPAGARVPYLGVMSARAVPAVRLYLRGPSSAQVAPFLRSAGWSDAAAELAPVLDDLSSTPHPLVLRMLHVDVAGAPLARVGVELGFAREPQLRGELAETAMLERLVDRGLCTRDRAEGLAAWPGIRFCALPHELWRGVMSRRVNCVKLVAGAGALEAKGYLLAFHHPGPTRRSEAATG
jgi:hypothetical protein